MRLRRTSCRHGNFQTKFSKIQKCCYYKQLILFKLFTVFLVSFGTVWKCLTLTGTFWSQFGYSESSFILPFTKIMARDAISNLLTSLSNPLKLAKGSGEEVLGTYFLWDSEKRGLPRRITPDFHHGQIVVHHSITTPGIYSFQKTLCPGRTFGLFEIAG